MGLIFKTDRLLFLLIRDRVYSLYSVCKGLEFSPQNFYLESVQLLIPRLLSVCVLRTFYSIKSSHDAPSD